ncbi:MAG: TrmH family RNA methyltransferase [Candidatus Dojkabacteria bacterium]|nr:TrmH family RNA methyltransferase [Candidatus Dojkabacteria bacterium]MDQ7020681.1 TrmH family RNA methyltransferase [Candidatus Dojkabacteria bacterium]
MHKPLKKSQIKKLLKRDSEKIAEHELVFILQDVVDPINVGSIFRTADGFNIKVILTGKTPVPPDNGISMTSRGLERSVSWEYIESISDAIGSLRNRGFEIIALELTEDSEFITEHQFSAKTAIVLGNEAIGVYKKTLDIVDSAVHIPMVGKGPSLNVNVAASIAAFEIFSRFIK